MGFWTQFQRMNMFQPNDHKDEHDLVLSGSKEDVLKNFVSISLQTKSSPDNKAWYKKPKDNKPIYIFFPGSEFDPRAKHYQEHIKKIQTSTPDIGIMVVSYPGFAGSKGLNSKNLKDHQI